MTITGVYDTECYPNYWLLMIQIIGGPLITFELRDEERFTPEQIKRIELIFAIHRVVSFNGNGYDVPMLRAAMMGACPWELKNVNDRIIVHRVKPWDLGLGEWKPADHIDIMEVCPGMGSQKQYAGRIHYRTMRDLPYEPDTRLTPEQIVEVRSYCGNDLSVLQALFEALTPQIKQREVLSERYGLDLRSKSDAQVAEAVLKRRCEQAIGGRIYKADVNWNLQFRYRVPAFITFSTLPLARALELVRKAVFRMGANGAVEMPAELDGLEIQLGTSTYKMGIGGLHSQEKKLVAVSDANYVLRMPDVASYYPNLMLNSGEYPEALGPAFIEEYRAIKDERLARKAEAQRLKKAGLTNTPEYVAASNEDAGGKIMINGTFGKTGSPYSILFAPSMLIQTTLTGQLALLMLIEWHEHYGIPVVSANTDGIVIKCPHHLVATSDALIAEWEKRTGLQMETDDYLAIFARDVNNYFAIKTPDDVKRKGEYARGGLIDKKNPDVEICADAVALYLAKGVQPEQTIRECRDIRKFVTIQKVAGGGVKMWGEGPRKDALVRDKEPVLIANGWVKRGRVWEHPERFTPMTAHEAYERCFEPQTPEYLGKVCRWYYSTRAPGPIVYAKNNNTVSLSYGARPCMTLPDEFPDDIDYEWYLRKALSMLDDCGFNTLR